VLFRSGIKEREAYEQGAGQLKLSSDELQKRIVALGRGIGPPWTQDQKYAALVGWLALHRIAATYDRIEARLKSYDS